MTTKYQCPKCGSTDCEVEVIDRSNYPSVGEVIDYCSNKSYPNAVGDLIDFFGEPPKAKNETIEPLWSYIDGLAEWIELIDYDDDGRSHDRSTAVIAKITTKDGEEIILAEYNNNAESIIDAFGAEAPDSPKTILDWFSTWDYPPQEF